MTTRRQAAVVTLAGATSLAMGLPLLMLGTAEEMTPTPTPTPTPTLEQLQGLADREDRLLDLERMSVDEARAAWREGAR